MITADARSVSVASSQIASILSSFSPIVVSRLCIQNINKKKVQSLVMRLEPEAPIIERG